jgi:hypothetical protein
VPKGFQKGHIVSEETRKKIGDANRRQVFYNCDYCGEESSDRPSHYKKTKRHFCNMKCYSLYRSLVMPSEEQQRFGSGMSDKDKALRVKCRSDLNHAISQGKIIRRSCRICDEVAEAHHEDYAKPLLIDWLCTRHHRQLHVIKRKTDNPELLEV